MDEFFCSVINESVNYSISRIDVSTYTDNDVWIPGIIRCSNEFCNSKKCPLGEMYSEWLNSRQ